MKISDLLQPFFPLGQSVPKEHHTKSGDTKEVVIEIHLSLLI